jgi:hypothetical protein
MVEIMVEVCCHPLVELAGSVYDFSFWDKNHL